VPYRLPGGPGVAQVGQVRLHGQAERPQWPPHVTSNSASTVSVISGRTNTVTATIPVGSRPAGAAVDPRTHTVYVANNNGGTASVFAPCPK
jgi:YVTN family beta-propeller protein